jgi:hypothetical protein
VTAHTYAGCRRVCQQRKGQNLNHYSTLCHDIQKKRVLPLEGLTAVQRELAADHQRLAAPHVAPGRAPGLPAAPPGLTAPLQPLLPHPSAAQPLRHALGSSPAVTAPPQLVPKPQPCRRQGLARLASVPTQATRPPHVPAAAAAGACVMPLTCSLAPPASQPANTHISG